MPNQLFVRVVNELDPFIGDILAYGLTNKAVKIVGSSPEMVTIPLMKKALIVHIKPSLRSFMSAARADECVKMVEKRIMEVKEE